MYKTAILFTNDYLGSVRVEMVGDTVEMVVTYEPFGNLLSQTGTGETTYGFTGEQEDSATGLLYLRARYYNPALRTFMAKDPWTGHMQRSISMHGYAYGYNSPPNLTDPSGLDPWWCENKGPYFRESCYGQYINRNPYAPCPVNALGTPGGKWDCEAVMGVRGLKQAFLDSATRHNRIPGMDNHAFAALIAAVIVSEGKLGNFAMAGNTPSQLFLENQVASLGCVVSGHFIKEAFDSRNWTQLFGYLTNQDIPGLATVGIGNMKLDTAANLWKGQACGHPGFSPECTSVQVSPLQGTNLFGIQLNLPNPYSQVVCMAGDCMVDNTVSDLGAYSYLASTQLLNNTTNVEYVAANLEAGALRAISKGLTPGAFNSATWHMWGIQSREDVARFPNDPGPYGPMGIVRNIPTALYVLGLVSSWHPEMDQEYVHWKGQGY